MTAPTTDAPLDASPMTAQVREVARLRRDHAALGARLDAATQAFVGAWQEVIDARKALGQRVAEAEAQLRGAAEAQFRLTGETKPAPGVAIKLYTTLDYADDAALAWAKSTGLALVPETYDRKALEKIAKATPLPFVTTIETPKAQLATDLDAALA